jgi:hypothetical protein
MTWRALSVSPWAKFATELRRAPGLEADLEELLGTSASAHAPTAAVLEYMAAITAAAEAERQPGRVSSWEQALHPR